MAEPIGAAGAFGNVLRRELRAGWRSALGWWLPTALLLAMTVSLQPEMAKKGSLFEQKLEMMPKAVMVAFGIVAKNLADPVYYLATNFMLVQLLGAVFAALLGAAALAREEAFGTSELLFAMPAGRRTIALGKIAAALGLVAAFDAGLLATTFATYAAIDVTLAQPGQVVALFGATAALHAAVFALGLLATVRTARPRGATSLALGVVFGLYGLGVVGSLSEQMSALRSLSPFHYAMPLRILEGDAVGGVATLLGIAVVAIAGALVLFERKDLRA